MKTLLILLVLFSANLYADDSNSNSNASAKNNGETCENCASTPNIEYDATCVERHELFTNEADFDNCKVIHTNKQLKEIVKRNNIKIKQLTDRINKLTKE